MLRMSAVMPVHLEFLIAVEFSRQLLHDYFSSCGQAQPTLSTQRKSITQTSVQIDRVNVRVIFILNNVQSLLFEALGGNAGGIVERIRKLDLDLEMTKQQIFRKNWQLGSPARYSWHNTRESLELSDTTVIASLKIIDQTPLSLAPASRCLRGGKKKYEQGRKRRA